jgi:hypothetical protein
MHRASASSLHARPSTFPVPLPSMRHEALWADLDSGKGLWENVPPILREAFRHLLALADETSSRQRFMATEAAQSEAALVARLEKLDEARDRAGRAQAGTDASLAALKG